MRLHRYEPCPVLVHPTLHPEVPTLREQGLVCMGPYANDRWYVFHPKPKVKRPVRRRTMRVKIYQFTGKHRRG